MTDNILAITDRALTKLLEVRNTEPDADQLGLVIQIAGIQGADYLYDLHLMVLEDAEPTDHVERHGDLAVVIPEHSVNELRGATVDLSRNLLEPGLEIRNPNRPSPPMIGSGPPPELEGPAAEQVATVLRERINPAIAAHGGFAELVAFEDGVVYVRLGGGCQGCGLASATLSQGIEATLLELVPEVKRVVDVTDHASGTNPYYEAAKK